MLSRDVMKLIMEFLDCEQREVRSVSKLFNKYFDAAHYQNGLNINPNVVSEMAAKQCRVDWLRLAIKYGLLESLHAIETFFVQAVNVAAKKRILPELQILILRVFQNEELIITPTSTQIVKTNLALLAALCGRTDITIDMLSVQQSNRLNSQALDYAVFGNHHETIQSIIGRYDACISDSTLSMAALGGHFDLLQYLAHRRAKPLKIPIEVLQSAARAGSLKILNWLETLRSNVDFTVAAFDDKIFVTAATCGHLHVLKWLCELQLRNDFVARSGHSACASAAENGHLEVLKWLRDPQQHHNGMVAPWDKWACIRAAENGHLNVLKWLRDPQQHQDGVIAPWDDQMCSRAALNGYLDVLKWLRDPHQQHDRVIARWDETVCGFAAFNGHLDVLKWLRDPTQHQAGIVAPWNEWTCASAAFNGHLSVLKWLRDPSQHIGDDVAPWDSSTCKCAIKNSAHKIIDWLLLPETQAPWDRNDMISMGWRR